MSEYNRRCIDGTIHGSSVCRGYCRYEGHPGHLTDKHMATHHCLEKGCHYYLPKPIKERVQTGPDATKEIMVAAEATVADMDGLKVMHAEKGTDGSWIVYYIAIAGYALQAVEAELTEKYGHSVRFQKLPYTFENAVSIILKGD